MYDLIIQNDVLSEEDAKSLYSLLGKNVDGYEKMPNSHLRVRRKPLKEIEASKIAKEFAQLMYSKTTFLEKEFFDMAHDFKKAAVSLNYHFFLFLDFLSDYSNDSTNREKNELLSHIKNLYENLNFNYQQARAFIRRKYDII